MNFPEKSILIGLVGCLLSACSSFFEHDGAKSGFAPVVGGEIDAEILGERNRSVSEPDVGTVAYLTGYTLSPGFFTPTATAYAFAGIAPGFNVGSLPVSAWVQYDATYAWGIVDDYDTSILGVSGRSYSGSGDILLIADFDARTVTGDASGLSVFASIDGQRVRGEIEVRFVPYSEVRTLDGRLSGYLGDTGIIAAFHGNNLETAVAGGVVGKAR